MMRVRVKGCRDRLGLIALVVGLTLVEPSAYAGGDPARGEELALVCSSCHGAEGNRSITPDIPLLAGQYYTYLVHSLRSYQTGERQNLIMSSFVGELSEQDIEDLAAWYADQTGDLHSPTAARIYP